MVNTLLTAYMHFPSLTAASRLRVTFFFFAKAVEKYRTANCETNVE